MPETIKCLPGCAGDNHDPACTVTLMSAVQDVLDNTDTGHELKIDFSATCKSHEHEPDDDKRMSANTASLVGFILAWLGESPDFLDAFRTWMLRTAVQTKGIEGVPAAIATVHDLDEDTLFALALAIGRGDVMRRDRDA
jgi:hypothetical protein